MLLLCVQLKKYTHHTGLQRTVINNFAEQKERRMDFIYKQIN